VGERRNVIPLVRDDVLQVAREAFRNAVLHARARVVQVDLNWGDERLVVRVRDDGVGLDPKLIAQGRDGHWGLQGMRERTRQLGGSLEIRSESDAGTVVELSIPAGRAYSRSIRAARDRRLDTV
jgi:signal transduction histidine kinase